MESTPYGDLTTEFEEMFSLFHGCLVICPDTNDLITVWINYLIRPN
jgi:hypothetical protein